MNSRRRRIAWVAALLIGGFAAVAGAYIWRTAELRNEAAAALPPRPDLRAFVAEFQSLVKGTESEVLSGWRPVQALAKLSRLYHANGFLAEAREIYGTLERLDPENARWPHLLANILAGYGQMSEALPLLRRTVELAPDYAPARIRLADALQKSNQGAEAQKIYLAVLAADPDNSYALLGLARQEVEAQNWAAARERLYAIPLEQRKLTAAWALLTTVEEKLGNDPAVAAASSAENSSGRYREISDPWVDELVRDCFDVYRIRVAAAISAVAGETVEARHLLERAMSLAPNDPTVHRNLADVLVQLGELASARSHLERAVAIAPEEPDAWNSLITLLNRLRDEPAIERALATGLRVCPQSPSLHFQRGRRLAAMGRLEEALAAFETSRRLRPQEAAAYVEIATLYFKLERLEEGVAELHRALVVDPGQPVALGILTRDAIQSGDAPAAQNFLRRLRLQPKVPPQDVQMLLREYQSKFGRIP